MTEKTAQEIIDLLTLNGRKPEHIKNGERVVYLNDAISIVRKALVTDHQPAFAVGEYYFYKSMENVLHILKITAVMGNIVEAGFLDTETGKLINTRIELDKKYVQPATAEQIATFKRAEHFASKGRKLDEFHVGDKVMISDDKVIAGPLYVDGFEDGYAVIAINGGCYYDPDYPGLTLIQTAEELQEVEHGEKV